MKKWSVTANKWCDPKRNSALLASRQWEASPAGGICSCVSWSPSALSFIVYPICTVSYFLGLTSAGSISQAPEWTAFHLNWLMHGTHGWLEGRRGGSNWLFFCFFSLSLPWSIFLAVAASPYHFQLPLYRPAICSATVIWL